MHRLSFQIIFLLLSINLFAQSPHGDNFDIDCSNCHVSDSWKVDLTKVTFDHSKTKFSLIGQHQNVDCKSCHTSLVFSNTQTDCISCHKDIHQGSVGFDCANCHTPTTWIVKDIIGLHQSGRFPLVGAHKFADCSQCHTGYAELRFDVLSVDCFACHKNDYNSTQSPNHVSANFSTDCQECHNVNAISWNTTNVNHSFFPLTGGHALPSCFSCHQQDTFSGLSPECYSCHQQNYESTQNPDHIAAGLPTACSVCHSITGWIPAAFNHNITQFPLTGRHINVECANCHTSGYTGTPTDCYACHQQDYQNTNDPNHVTSGYPTDCTLCHTTSGWDDANFDHNTSQFPLTGAHVQTACASCHASGYTGTPTDCYSCHQQNYQSTTDPNHVLENYPHDCSVCHNTINWDDANFDHNTSQFPLTGAHVQTACAGCHTSGFTGTPTDCYSCHQQNYQSTTDPNHVLENYPHDCSICHNTTNWDDANFDHNTSQFPLTGAHVQTDCASCHTSGYTGTPTDCYSCHQQNYQSTTDPNHVAENYPQDCTLCHNTSNWNDANFDHNNTQFPLTGTHIQTSCASCHTSGYTGTPTDCYSCHQQDYQSTTDPNHVLENYPHDCTLCHNTSNWNDANFDHNNTQFPLTGSHIQTACASCHTSGYTGTPTDCYSCHQQNYESTTDPNHVLENYPHDCSICHNTTNWDNASFDHNTSQFPLTGAHIQVACASCHTNGYTGTPTDCAACHQTDYNNTTNPNHQAAGFPTTCVDCHSTTAWTPATFEHDTQYFPIYSGKHAGTWNQCSECHTVPNNFTSFSCIDCHEHNRTDTDEHHQGVQGYVYSSEECYACHPQGRSEGAFNHATSNFVLVGVHLNVECAQCHQSGYTNTPALCVDCHIPQYNNSTNPNHQTLVLSTDCSTCHTPSANWQPALFPQHDQVYQLLGRHAEIANDCVNCHNGNYTTTPNQCVGCHQSAYNAAVNPNHSAAGIPTECSNCHNATAWIPSSFDHATTGFELLGSHQPLQCSSCHIGTLSGLNNECISCHQAQFNSAPNHIAQSYPITCELCHNSVAWNQASFDHQNTNFPLTGAHTSVNCQQCHSSGYTGTLTECYACHQTNYEQSTNPNHTALALSTACQDCHTTNPDWQPATFPVHNNFYQLLGAHLQINNCTTCHQGGNYNNTPNTCIGCHSNDYNGTTDPPHQTLNFSENCLSCHTMTGWTPANFNHSFFPTGSHHTNVDCNECHSEINYQPQCLSCHMNDFLEEHHLGDRTDCWNCHGANNWDRGVISPHLQELKID